MVKNANVAKEARNPKATKIHTKARRKVSFCPEARPHTIRVTPRETE